MFSFVGTPSSFTFISGFVNSISFALSLSNPPNLPPPTTGGFKPFFGNKKPIELPMKPPSIGGVGGISGRRSMRPMMRAGGGAIGQAIADLQNRLR